jgi:hypothetical protein
MNKRLTIFISLPLILLMLGAFILTPSQRTTNSDWISLFDGKTLNGWVQKNGTATYEVVDGAIRGTTNTGSPNSFLCTFNEFGDFKLSFEVLLHDEELNSGVQIRSRTREAEGDETFGRVNGPQVEIEAGSSDSPESGYIYGEGGTGGWLVEEEDRTYHDAFQDGEWNQYKVIAEGPRIQVWINGEKITDLWHEKIYMSHPRGFIGLQVHGISEDEGPYSVSWRNIRIKPL